jgi:nucleoside 2-deoxyribosyltransferase
MLNKLCPICNIEAKQSSMPNDSKQIECPRCGHFSISYEAATNFKTSHPERKQIANASGWIREHQNIQIISNNIESLLLVAQPTVPQRATKILQLLAHLSIDISSSFNIDIENAPNWLGASYSDHQNELRYLFNYLRNTTNFISFSELSQTLLVGVQITPNGYEYLESLRHSQTSSKIGFCAMWFNQELLPIWSNAIEPAIKDSGYAAKRIDNHPHNNRIDDEIIAMLRRSKFIVADFTGQRGGVYFEAGFALGLGLQVIWTCKASELKDVHFDNRQYNFVLWEEDKLDDFKMALQNRIEATIGRGNLN